MSTTTSGYEPEYMQYHVAHFVLIVVFSGFAITAVILRFWARKIQKQGFALHDYLTALGLIFALAEGGVNIYGCCFPIQRRMGTVSKVLGLQLLFLSPIFWITAVTTIRAAIMVLYIQVFPTRPFFIACYTALAVNLLFGASAVIANCLICRPITYRWAPNLIDGSCGDQKMLDMSIAILNLLQDVVVVVLPMPVLWGLQMATTRKVALSCMFGMGIMICAITIYRVQVTSTIGDPTDLHAQDTYCRILLLTSLEALFGIISACLPVLKPVLRKLQGSLSERGTDTNKFPTSGSIPIVMHGSQMPTSSPGKHRSSDSSSREDSFWYGGREADGKREKRGWSKLEADRVMVTEITEKPRYREGDAESLIGDV
ncbi:MAG: hypothetical protein ASARMPRED_002559 [Alectoria sarmentosa]|nr:MAG: hypothetical protein ASARMPRED_002559 [Alectoria sarmentosa]